MLNSHFSSVQRLSEYWPRFVAVLFFFITCTAVAVPTGNFRYPTNGHSFDGNMLFSVRVDDPDGLGRVIIRFNNSASSELLVCNCGNDTFKSFTDAGIKPRDLNLDIGSHTAQLITNSTANNQNSGTVVDTISFSWNPPEITGVQVNRSFGSLTINWSPLSGYSTYNLYIASVPEISPENANNLPESITFRALRSTSQAINGVDDEQGLFGLITGTDRSGESAFSQIFRIEAVDNQDPIIGVDSFSLNEDSPVSGNVLSNDSDPENQTLTASLVTQPTNGNLNLNSNGAFTYTPATHFNGIDQFTYTANDPQGGSQLGTVTLNVTAVNDAPTAVNDNYDANEDTPLNIDVSSGVLSNDSDIESDSLSATVLNTTQNGSLTLNTTGSFSYIPSPQFSGTDNFTYQLSDGNGGSDTASVSITVNSVNDAPVANNDSYQTSEDSSLTVNANNGVLSNDTDADAGPGNLADELSASLITTISNGTLELSVNGSFVYTPNNNFFGEDSFIYQVTDSAGVTDQATVTITVSSVNDNPIAVNDSYTLDEDSVLTVNAASGLLANDTDIEDSNNQLTASLVTAPQNGDITIESQGGFTYTPNGNYFGTDTLTYRVTDSQSGTATAQVTFQITPVSEAPIANDDVYQVNEDETLVVSEPGIGLLANDSDPDIVEADKFSQLTVTVLTPPATGDLRLETNGTFTYTPTLNFFGGVTFTYQVADLEGQTATANVTIDVVDVADVPVTETDSYNIDEDILLSVSVADGILANDVDPAGGSLTASVLTQPVSGILSLSSDGSFSYQPNENFNGSDSFVYLAVNAPGLTAQETVTISVTSVNDAPVAVDDVLIIDERANTDVEPLENDIDVDGDNIRIIAASAETGTVTFTNTTISYIAPGNPGEDVISYTIADPSNEQASATISVIINNVEEAPVAADDTASTNEDTPVTLTPMDNDVDPDGDALTLSAGTATNGTVTVEDASLTFIPEADFNGAATVSYFITDTTGNMATANIAIEVLPVNDAPIAVDDEAFVVERDSVTFDPRGNDSDVDGDVLTITAAALDSTDSTSGEISFTASDITFTAPAAPGVVSISYTISDPDGATASALVKVAITNVDDSPVTQNDVADVDEDLSVTLFPLGNDSDPDGDELTLSVQNVTNGTATLASTTSILFTPLENFNGTATITYLATDPGGNSAVGSIEITVNPVNDAPVALDDQISVSESATTEIQPLANDTDVDGDPLSISQATATNGSLTFNNTTIAYTAPDIPGEDTISYTISDTSGATSSASISITVNNIQDAPVAVDDFTSTDEDTAIQIFPLSNDSDEDGDNLTVTIDGVSSGTTSLSDNTINYTPAINFNGIATIAYTISDTANNTDSATISITVNAVNDVPVAADDAVTTTEDTPVQINPLSNDVDVDGDDLTVTVVSTSTGAASVTDNIVNYIPVTNFNGTANILYQISDTQGATATATITITVSAINDLPIANDDSATTPEDTPVQISPLANDSDPDNSPLTVSVISVSSGAATISDNVVNYTPTSNFNGVATINYQITDDQGASASAAITITVTAVNDAPVAVDDTASTTEDSPVQISPLSNDSDADNDTLTLTIQSTSSGTSTLNGNVLTYTPETNFNGVATVNYQISDTQGATATATITITISANNDSPVAVDDSATTAEDTPVQISPLANDSDPDNDTLTVSVISVSSGTATVDSNIVTYTPASDFNGAATISYRIGDPSGATATATITVNVTAVNDNPIAVDDSANTNEDTPVDIKPLDNDSDADSDPLSFTLGNVTNGTASAPANDTITFTPTENFNGAATIQYTLSDGAGGSASATITINVTAVNDPPVAAADTATVDEGASVTISPLTNDSDADGDNLTVTAATVTTGSVAVNSDATTLTYTAPTGFTGTATISYTLTDTKDSVTGTVTVTVNDINHPPVAVNDSYNVNAGETTTLSVLTNDTDTDNDTLTITTASATQGAVTISTDTQSLSYTAPSNINTTDTVNYTISDPSGATSTASATITVAEQAFSGDFDSDGDGTTDVTATASGSDYVVTFGSNVGAVYYDDNGSTVAVTNNDSGVFELTIEGTAPVNGLANGLMRNLIDLGGKTAPAADHVLPASANEVKFTINGEEFGFSVYDLDQSTANVAFLPPKTLRSGFNAQTSFDFFLRYPSFTGPVRLGLDNGEHYVLNTDGTGTIRGTDFDLDVTWQETNTQLVITVLNDVESTEFISVYHLDDDNSDGIALGVITRAEADAYVNATSTNMVQVFTKDVREVFTFIRDHQIYIDAKSERYLSYRIDSTANPTITSATTAVNGIAPAETQDFELWDISQLKVNPISFSDIQGGIATYIPRITNNQFEDFVADTCLFSESTTGSNSGSGSCVFASQSFTWSITNNVLKIDFGNSIVADYRWLDDLAFENTFSIELAVGSGSAQQGYSSYVYWLPLGNLTDSQVSTFITNNYLDSALVKTNPDARMSDGSINTQELSGFYFATNELAKNLDSVTSFFGTEIIDTDRKWNISNSLITVQSLSSISSGNTFSFVYDQCTNSNDASCFVWQFSELFPIAIDGNKLWVWETVLQNQDGFEFKGSVNYKELIPPRIQFYELNSVIPGAPNSINFNREPIWSKIELTTDESTPLTNVSLSSFFSDPESDSITLTQADVDSGTGSVTLNSSNTITYTPAAGFVGTTNLYIDATDGVNEVFPTGVITVRTANQAPVANDDTATALSGLPASISPLSNDTDANSDALVIAVATPGTGQGVVSIVNDTQLEYTPPATFTGDAIINYSISDGRGGTASATITVTVSKPLFSGSYDLDNSSVSDFTITEKSGTFTVTFSSEVSAVYYTLNGQKFLLSKNSSGGYDFDYPPNTSPIPVLTYVINGVSYTFAPDDLTQTVPNLVYSGFTTVINDFGSLSSYQLIGRATPHNSALNTALENGVLYDLRTDGTGDFNSNLIADTVTWTQTDNTITVNLDDPTFSSAFVNVYDLDDEVNEDQAYGLITRAQADNFVATTGIYYIYVDVETLGYQLTATSKQSFFYEVNRNYLQEFSIDARQYPTFGNIGPVSVSVSDTPRQLLNTAEFSFKPITSADIVGTIHLPVPVTNSSDFFSNFASDTCTLSETNSGSNSGTGTCGSNNRAITWAIQNDGSVNATFGSSVNVSYRWLNSGPVENTFFVGVTDASNLTYTTIDYWFTSPSISAAQVSSIVAQNNYLERDDIITNPLGYSAPGIPFFYTANGLYLGTSGLAKSIQALSLPGSLFAADFTFDADVHWSTDGSGVTRAAAQSNVSSSDTFKYVYSQCTNSNDQNCYQWEVRSLEPLAIDGNRLWVMESTTQDPDQGQTYDPSDGLEPSGDNYIRFYEITSTIPGAPNSISFNQEPVQLSQGNLTVTTNTTGTLDILSLVGDPDSNTLSVLSAQGNGSAVVNSDSSISYTPVNGFVGITGLNVVVSDGINDVNMIFDVQVTPLNAEPTDILVDGMSAISVTRNTTGSNFTLGSLTTIDDDTTDSHSYSLVTTGTSTFGTCTADSGNSNFSISGSSLRSLAKLAPATYDVCVQTDDAITTFQKTLSITVTNNAPTDILLNGVSGITVTRNSTGNSVTLGALTTSDTDTGESHSYALVNIGTSNSGTCSADSGNSNFNIFGSSLRSQAKLAPATYQVCLQTDDTSVTFQKTLSITVTNNAPTDITISNASINDKITGVNVPIGSLSTTDTDSSDSHTYALVNMGTSALGACTADSGNTSFNISGTSLRTTNTLPAGTYDVCVQTDDSSTTFEKNLTITVVSSNTPPVAVNDSVTVLPLSSGNSIDVLVNDSDPDTGDTITVVSASVTSSGSASPANDGLSVIYNAPSAERTDTITYTIADSNGAQATATVAVTMNTNPTATASTGFISTSASKTFTPSVTDADGDTTTVIAASVTSGNASGSVSGFSGSSITFDSTGVEGTAVIDYTVQDIYSGTASSTITVTVNSAPTVTGETYTFDSTTAISVPAVSGVLANDSDPNSESLTVTLLSGPGHSSAFNLNQDGSFNYTHDNMTVLTDGFSYTVSDSTHTINGYANINIVKENFAPELCSAPPAYARVGEAFSHTFTGVDSGTMSLSGNGLSNHPAWLSIAQTDSSTFAITGTPTSSDIGKSSDIQATITDGVDTAYITFDITVESEFGSANKAQFNLLNNTSVLEAVKDIAIDNKGRIVVVGETNSDFLVARFLPNGTLDSSFDVDGVLTIDFNSSTDSAQAVGIRKDNGIVVAGNTDGNTNWAMTALNEDGSLDNNFGTSGKLVQADFAGTHDETITDLILRDDGRIVVVGTHIGAVQEGFVAARYLANGTLDSSFNSNGYLIHTHSVTTTNLLATTSLLDQDGGLYVGGYTIETARSDSNDMYLIKITDSGLDIAFNTTGNFSFDDSGNEQLYDMVFDGSGNLLLAGQFDTDMAVYQVSITQSGSAYTVARDTDYSDGDSDDDRFTFNNGGNEVVHRIIPDGFGNYYIVGKDGNSNTLAIKLSSDGIKDTNFGTGGVKTISLLSPPFGEEAVASLLGGQLLFADADVINSATDSIVQLYRKQITSVSAFGNNCGTLSDYENANQRTEDNLVTGVFASDDSIYLVGHGTELGSTRTFPTATFEDFLVAKVGSTGNLVSDFGSNGTYRFDNGSTKSWSVTDAVTMASDSLLIVGKDGATSSFAQIFLARVTAAGELDTSFDSDGLLDLTGSVALDDAQAVYLAGSDKFLLAGKGENDSSNPVYRVYRYNNNGSVDNTFGMGTSFSSLDNSVNYTDFEDTYYNAAGIEVVSSGDIYFIGDIADEAPFYGEVILIKYNSSGLRDNLFGSSGSLRASGNNADYSVKATTNDGTNIYVFADNLNASSMEVLKFNLTTESLDSSFGNGGIVVLSDYIENTYPDIEVDSSGKIWLSTKHFSNGDSLVRLDAKGNFDGVFLNAGQVPLTHEIELWDEIRGIELNSNNEAAIFGVDAPTLNSDQRSDFKLVFTNTNGVVSNNESQISIDFGSGSDIKGIAIGNEGDLYLAGSGVDSSTFIENFLVAKYNTEGTGDSSFGTTGQNNSPIKQYGFSQQTSFNALSMSNSNDLFLSGEFKGLSSSDKDFFAVKVEPDSATLDNGDTFPIGNTDINTRTGNGGSGSNDIASGQYLADDGSLYVVGSRDGIGVVVKYNKSSISSLIDTSFGTNGELYLSGQTTSSHLNDITMSADGVLIAVGYAETGGNRNGLITRFTPAGVLDEGFNSTGVVEFSATTTEEQFNTVTLGPNGNIIASGHSGNDALVVMYTGAGALNTSFDTNGYKTLDFGSSVTGQEVFTASQADDSGGIVLLAQVENKFTLIRLDTTGSKLYDSGIQSLGVYNEMQALSIDKLGGVYLAGSAQVDGSYNWQLVVVRFPNVVGSF